VLKSLGNTLFLYLKNFTYRNVLLKYIAVIQNPKIELRLFLENLSETVSYF